MENSLEKEEGDSKVNELGQEVRSRTRNSKREECE